MKNLKIIITAVCYALLTAAMIAFVLIFPEMSKAALVGYVCFVALSAGLAAGIELYLGRETAVKHRANIEKMADNINAMVIVWDTDFEDIFVNNELTRITGYTAEDLIADEKKRRNLLPEDAFNKENFQAIINSRDEEFNVTCKGGSVITTIWNTSLMNISKSGSKIKYLMMSIGSDLTETMKLKDDLLQYSRSLAETENKYALSMELSEIGLILKEPDKDLFYLSDQLLVMLGLENEYVKSNVLRSRVHPKDMVLFESFADGGEALADSGDINKIHSSEIRLRSSDDTYHWYMFRYKIMPNSMDSRLTSVGGAVMDITKDKEKDSLIERMAYIDEVTQIYNRNKFMMIGQEAFECAKDSGGAISYWVIVLDIDKFHIINDTCGYNNGNKLLAEVAAAILSNLTSGGFGARIGGDNFALLIKDNGNDNYPLEIIRKIQNRIANLNIDIFSNQTITCSAGYCKMSDGGSDFATVLEHSEFSLSLSDGTRGNIIRYDNSVHEKILAGNTIENELASAIDNRELVLYYQPKINLADGEIIGVEALIRWKKPDGTLIPPSAFIPVAENSLLITKISDFVLGEACRQNKAWQDMGLPPITVSINLTSVDFYQTDVKESLQKALAKTGLKPEYLEVELTESLALKDIDQAIHQMKELREIGVKLSMDDFGTGYSSLSYIQVLPITLLKLDRSFIMYLEEDEISREIVSAVIRIAKSKKIETIAEGIETIGQAEILKESGCDHAQGYFFGKPMPAEEFEKFVKTRKKIVV